MLFSLGGAPFAPLGSALIADYSTSSKQETQYQGYLAASQSIGMSLGPAFGAWDVQCSRVMFWCATVIVSSIIGITVGAITRKTHPLPIQQMHSHTLRTDMDTKILLIDPASSGSLYRERFTHLAPANARLVNLWTQRSLTAGLVDSVPEDALQFSRDSHNSVEELIRYCQEQGISQVLIGSEPGVPLALELCAEGWAHPRHCQASRTGFCGTSTPWNEP